VWAIEDFYPRTASNLVHLGRDITSRPTTRATFSSMLNLTAGRNITEAGQVLALTPIFFISVTAKVNGFAIYSSVYDDDPMRTVVGVVVEIEQYFAKVRAQSPHVAAVLTDHAGNVFEDPLGGCPLAAAELVVTRTIAASPSQTWRVDLGMCPAFRTHDTEYVQAQRARVVYVAIIVGGALAAMGAVACLGYCAHREMALQVSLAKQVCVRLSVCACVCLLVCGCVCGGWCAW
jgi:hypothetical protein